jgi:hypothetical protein
MTPDALRAIGEALFGKWGWQTKLAKALRVDGSTVRRWISGTTTIPGPAEVALELLLSSHQRNIKDTASRPNTSGSSGTPNTQKRHRPAHIKK